MRYQARAPLRIDFGGGWTDVPLYAQNEGGAVLNAAISRYVRGFIARPGPDGPLAMLRGDRSYVSYSLDLPSGAGLGASAAQTVLWVTLVKTSIANVSDRVEIAEIAYRVEAALGILGGKQDEYASALGGINYFRFGDEVRPERLHLNSSVELELEDRLVLVYSGERRLSSDIHARVWESYLAGEKRTVTALANLRRIAGDMRSALAANNLDSFGELLTENWQNQRALHPSVSDARLDSIFELALASGAIGGKACGAGGGGCLIFLSGPGRSEELRQALRERRLALVDFTFDSYGVYLTKG